MQSVAAGHLVPIYLLGQPAAIALACVLVSFFDLSFGIAQSAQALRTHEMGGFSSLADLEVDASAYQLDGVVAVVAPDQQLCSRKL
jgi:hypothetical protein